MKYFYIAIAIGVIALIVNHVVKNKKDISVVGSADNGTIYSNTPTKKIISKAVGKKLGSAKVNLTTT